MRPQEFPRRRIKMLRLACIKLYASLLAVHLITFHCNDQRSKNSFRWNKRENIYALGVMLGRRQSHVEHDLQRNESEPSLGNHPRADQQ